MSGRPNLPPPGVSEITEGGGHRPVVSSPSRQTRRRGPGEDVLKNVHELKTVDNTAGLTPDGVQAVQRDVRIGKMPKTRRSRRNTVTFRSVDGEEYTFRTHDQKGKELETNRLFLLFAAIRETILGGNPQNVFDSWGVKLLDMDGKQFYPVPQETLERMMAERDVLETMGMADDDDRSEFALGQSE